jgi:hypothetical protein
MSFARIIVIASICLGLTAVAAQLATSTVGNANTRARSDLDGYSHNAVAYHVHS